LRNSILLVAGILTLLQPLAGFAKSKEPSPHSNSLDNSDVIIAGAGLAGLSAALKAGRSGAKVSVVDEAFMSEGELNIVA
jgi:NADPH-dependent 2,4-dienoyl-CoA reductase/sulfur reductase-like enzyme